jgi:hypothetical protein
MMRLFTGGALEREKSATRKRRQTRKARSVLVETKRDVLPRLSILADRTSLFASDDQRVDISRNLS